MLRFVAVSWVLLIYSRGQNALRIWDEEDGDDQRRFADKDVRFFQIQRNGEPIAYFYLTVSFSSHLSHVEVFYLALALSLHNKPPKI
jgi:hypothetical protein